ncbi:MAG TPA: hypothetical protein VEV87_01680 [Chitinophagaceae bacterium]|nr:hypothetical protein [Chitinophagaceae bacterium]
MNRFSILLFSFILISACNKNDDRVQPGPDMKYTDLQQAEVKTGTTQRLDLDEDGTIDFSLQVILIGDPVAKEDRHTFVAGSTIDTYLLAIDNTETGKRLNKGELIGLVPPGGFEWFQVARVVMAEKIISESKPPYWRGEWKDGSHQFLSVQIGKNGSRYNGWIEISTDTNGERMILHKAAISKVPYADVRAGY